MTITLGPEADHIIHRIESIDLVHVSFDKRRVEAAIQQHLVALGMDPKPVRWVSDMDPWLHSVLQSCLQYRKLLDATYTTFPSSVFRQARMLAYIAINNIFLEAPYMSVCEVLSNVAYYAGLVAIKHRYLDNADEIDHHYSSLATRFIPVWRPFIEALDAGLWRYWVCEDEIILISRPSLRFVAGFLHHDSGPAVRWPNGPEYYYWKGTRVTRQIIEAPDTLTPAQIDEEVNAERRRIMIERFGTERYIREGSAKLIASDPVHGDLYRKSRSYDSDIVMLHVKNNTTEPDGTIREFWIRVHPECRPFRARDGWIGKPQRMTPLNARASTWGLTGKVFKNLAEAS